MIDELNVGDQFTVSEDYVQLGAEFVVGTTYTVVESGKDNDWYDWYAVTPGGGANGRWYFGLDPHLGDLSSKIQLVIN